ncbi:MAG: tetratricopeptide repeat protein [Bacteroidales bacterium]|nr:tetratricopeptide repeat protein [Bacteroidales bacterium]
MRIYSIVLVLGMVLMASCQGLDKDSQQGDLKQQVMHLQERLMKASASIDPAQGDSVVALYKMYAEEYPDDSISVEYLYRAAGVEMGMDKNENCLQTLALIEQRYPNSDLIPSLLQLKAFIYDTKFQDYDKARAAINELVEKYPNDKLTPNAKAYRDMIGKDPEELFRRIDSTQAAN